MFHHSNRKARQKLTSGSGILLTGPTILFFGGEWGLLWEFGLGKQLQALSRHLTDHPDLQDRTAKSNVDYGGSAQEVSKENNISN